MVAGVCAAVGRATNTDPALWRVLFAVLALAGGVGLLAYLVGWLLIPAEGRDTPAHGIRGRVREIVFGGERLSIHVDTPVGEILVCEPNGPGGGDARLQPGLEVIAHWQPADLMVFDRK